MPKVSVVLTSFNHEKYICEAIDSVLNQSFPDFELIILDDLSSDRSWDLITEYSDRRIKAFRDTEHNGGMVRFNKAIAELASGQYIAIHHSDDVWEPRKLERQVALLDSRSDIGAVFTDASIIGDDGSPFTDESHFYFSIFDQPNRTRHEWLRFFFKAGNVLCHPSVLIRKACYDDVGLYRFGFWQLADLDMWIRVCLNYEIHIIREKLIRFRVRDNQANTSASRPDTRIRSTYETYKLLQHYRRITRFDDLVRVFPTSREFDRNDNTDAGFALGMAALEEPSYPIARLFGQDLLSEALSDPERAKNIKQQYDFDELKFIGLTGRNDVFLVEEVTRLRQAMADRDGQISSLTASLADRDGQMSNLTASLAERDARVASLARSVAERETKISDLIGSVGERGEQVARLADLIQKIYRSRSWRITAPLRFMASRLRKITNATTKRNTPA